MLLLETLQSSAISATHIEAWTAHDSALSKVAERVLSSWSDTTDETLLPYHNGEEMSSPWKMAV